MADPPATLGHVVRWSVLVAAVVALGASAPGRSDARRAPGIRSGAVPAGSSAEAVAVIPPRGAAGAGAAARRVPSGGDPFARITSPDSGTWCAAALDAASLTRFWSKPLGDYAGG